MLIERTQSFWEGRSPSGNRLCSLGRPVTLWGQGDAQNESDDVPSLTQICVALGGS